MQRPQSCGGGAVPVQPGQFAHPWELADGRHSIPDASLNPIRPYLFFNSGDANQIQILLIWSSLPCLILGLRQSIGLVQRLMVVPGVLIAALGIFLMLASKGDGALLALTVGTITSWLLLRRKTPAALHWFVLALGLGTLLFVVLNLTIGSADLFGDVLARNSAELDPNRGRLQAWLAHGQSMLNNQLWLGAGYRAIPTGSQLCGPHNIIVSLSYSLGLPGLCLAGVWLSSMQWPGRSESVVLQSLAPGVFSAL